MGICYGKVRTSYVRNYLKVVGQSFWYLISRNEDLYLKIVEPLGYEAQRHNDDFLAEKAKIINQFTAQFLDEFCDDGAIDWEKLVAFNSQNINAGKIKVKKMP